jgi:hypothetical protein
MNELILLCSICLLTGVISYLYTLHLIIIIPVSKYPSDEERQRIIEYLEDVIAELDCMGDE